MKKLLLSLAVAALVAPVFTSCAVMGTPAGSGLLFTSMQSDAHVTSNTLGTKVGRASASNILGLAVTGDASVETAAKSAGIKQVSHVDVRRTNILGLFSTYTVYVYGE